MGSSDLLRGYYLRSPRWVQAGAGRLLALAPPRMVYGHTYRALRADIDRSRRDAAFVDERVRSLLRMLLFRARETPYYCDLLAGVDVDNPSRADLARLPVLTRADVRRDADRMLTVPKSELDESMTSGTSEAYLSVYLDRDRSVREWAFVTHAWAQIGYRLGDRRACLRASHGDFREVRSRYWMWHPGTRELRLSPFRMVPPIMEEYLDLIRRFRVAYVYGYSSAIALLAAHAARIGWSPPARLKGVIPISESLLPYQRQIIREGFGPIAIVRHYGLTEKVAFAGEIPGAPEEYEFEPLYGIAEVVDAKGDRIGPGQRGRLVGTGFISMGMPLIRYDTGDLATVVRSPSRENCWRLRVKHLVSRYRQDYLVTGEGGLVTPIVAAVYNKLLLEYQLVQHEPGRATLRVIPDAGVTREQLESIARNVSSASDGLMSVDIEVVKEIPTTARGKRKTVEQHLDLSQYGLADAQFDR